MGSFFSYPAICPIYPESDDEDSTCEYISSPILSAVIHDDYIVFDDDVNSLHEEKTRKRANIWKNAS